MKKTKWSFFLFIFIGLPILAPRNVLLDPQDRKAYCMDVSFLPELQNS